MTLPGLENFAGAAGFVSTPPWQPMTFITGLSRDGSGHGIINNTGFDGYDAWIGDTLPNDQYAEVQADYTPPGAFADYIYLFLRVTWGSGAIQTGYWLWSDGVSDTAIVRVDSGVQTVLASSSSITFVSGDVLKAQIIGSAIELLKNGVSVLTATDSAYASGPTGLGGYTTDNVLSMTSFETDAAGGGGGGPTVHSGLTGTGSFAPSGAVVAIEIDIDAIPVGLGTGMGNPIRYFEIGNVSFEFAEAYSGRNYFLEHQHEIVVTQFSEVTHVNYSFAAGITAVITEISTF